VQRWQCLDPASGPLTRGFSDESVLTSVIARAASFPLNGSVRTHLHWVAEQGL
jgi:hypothetical protein